MDEFLVGISIMPTLNRERLVKMVLYAEMLEGSDLALYLGSHHSFAAVKQLGLTIKAELKELNRDVEVRVLWLD
jgi:hypothetical protein